MKVYAGIDLHSNNSVVVVLDEQDRVLVERRVANELERVLGVLEPYRGDLVGVVVESTYNWYWLVDGLMQAGLRVHLANTAAIKQYEGLGISRVSVRFSPQPEFRLRRRYTDPVLLC